MAVIGGILPAITAVTSIIGGVVGAIGAIQAANAQAAAAEYNRQVEERNKRAVLQQGDQAAVDQTLENKRRLAAVRASYGAANIDLAGSPLDVIEDTAIEQELDVKRIRYKAELGAIEHQDAATRYKLEAENATKAGRISAVSSILGGFTSAGQSLLSV